MPSPASRVHSRLGRWPTSSSAPLPAWHARPPHATVTVAAGDTPSEKPTVIQTFLVRLYGYVFEQGKECTFCVMIFMLAGVSFCWAPTALAAWCGSSPSLSADSGRQVWSMSAGGVSSCVGLHDSRMDHICNSEPLVFSFFSMTAR